MARSVISRFNNRTERFYTVGDRGDKIQDYRYRWASLRCRGGRHVVGCIHFVACAIMWQNCVFRSSLLPVAFHFVASLVFVSQTAFHIVALNLTPLWTEGLYRPVILVQYFVHWPHNVQTFILFLYCFLLSKVSFLRCASYWLVYLWI